MSGEAGPEPAAAAARRFAAANPAAEVALVGDPARLSALAGDDPRVSVVAAPGVVRMDEPPAGAIRRRDTSMRRALELLAENKADAVVSAGNTGALLGLGVLVLRLVNGAARPAIASFVPNLGGTGAPGDFSCMLDLGANVECDSEMLRQFAVMGAALTRAVKNTPRPSVRLLNIGEEQFKGRDELKAAAAKLESETDLRFDGNMEGYDIYRGAADVIVCDGFTGNVALKVSEGLAAMLSRKIGGAFRAGPAARLCGIAAWPVLRKLRAEMDHRKYNGACLLGLRGVVVKSHGNADAEAFAAAIQFAAKTGSGDVVGVISRALERASNENESGDSGRESDSAGRGLNPRPERSNPVKVSSATSESEEKVAVGGSFRSGVQPQTGATQPRTGAMQSPDSATESSTGATGKPQ